MCVFAYYSNDYERDCVTVRTKVDGSATQRPLEDDGDDDNTGAVVGAVIGAVVLLALVIGIVYLVIRRRQPKKAKPSRATPPRTFTKAELPDMMPVETRTFTKPKRRPNNDATDTAMQVVAISDGQTGGGQGGTVPHVGRAGRLLSNDGYKDMSGMPPPEKKMQTSNYENDHGPLPPTPRISAGSRPPSYGTSVSYTNQGFKGDNYDEVDYEI